MRLHVQHRNMKNQKGFAMVLLIVFVVVAALAVVGLVLYRQKLNSLTQNENVNQSAVPAQYQAQYQQSGQSVAPIQDANDLNSASASLDSTDTTQLDTQLNQLNSNASSF